MSMSRPRLRRHFHVLKSCPKMGPILWTVHTARQFTRALDPASVTSRPPSPSLFAQKASLSEAVDVLAHSAHSIASWGHYNLPRRCGHHNSTHPRHLHAAARRRPHRSGPMRTYRARSSLGYCKHQPDTATAPANDRIRLKENRPTSKRLRRAFGALQ